jgi:hypothetical protein
MIDVISLSAAGVGFCVHNVISLSAAGVVFCVQSEGALW